MRPGHGRGLLDEELGAAAGHEHPGIHGDAQSAEPRPTQHMLQGQTVDPAPQHLGEFHRTGGRGDEQLRLGLGEHATGGAKAGDHSGRGQR